MSRRARGKPAGDTYVGGYEYDRGKYYYKSKLYKTPNGSVYKVVKNKTQGTVTKSYVSPAKREATVAKYQKLRVKEVKAERKVITRIPPDMSLLEQAVHMRNQAPFVKKALVRTYGEKPEDVEHAHPEYLNWRYGERVRSSESKINNHPLRNTSR